MCVRIHATVKAAATNLFPNRLLNTAPPRQPTSAWPAARLVHGAPAAAAWRASSAAPAVAGLAPVPPRYLAAQDLSLVQQGLQARMAYAEAPALQHAALHPPLPSPTSVPMTAGSPGCTLSGGPAKRQRRSATQHLSLVLLRCLHGPKLLQLTAPQSESSCSPWPCAALLAATSWLLRMYARVRAVKQTAAPNQVRFLIPPYSARPARIPPFRRLAQPPAPPDTGPDVAKAASRVRGRRGAHAAGRLVARWRPLMASTPSCT